jgi:hypothetical protein
MLYIVYYNYNILRGGIYIKNFINILGFVLFVIVDAAASMFEACMFSSFFDN